MPADAWHLAIVDALALATDRLLTLALGPDDLLLEPEVRAALEAQDPPVGLLTLGPGDPIAFRYAYESEYRSRWDDGEPVRLLARLPGTDPKEFPYDLLARAGGMRQVRESGPLRLLPQSGLPGRPGTGPSRPGRAPPPLPGLPGSSPVRTAGAEREPPLPAGPPLRRLPRGGPHPGRPGPLPPPAA